MEAQEVLQFWFEELEPNDWFIKSDAVDAEIYRRFFNIHQAAIAGELSHWRKTVQGRLAEIIVLDQFSRNLYREDARSFLYDGMALVLAQEALPYAKELTVTERSFLYMPFMHSESLAIHQVAEKLFSEPGMEKRAKYEQMHRNIIEQFGRYPHRNKILGRKSTEKELEFLRNHSGF